MFRRIRKPSVPGFLTDGSPVYMLASDFGGRMYERQTIMGKDPGEAAKHVRAGRISFLDTVAVGDDGQSVIVHGVGGLWTVYFTRPEPFRFDNSLQYPEEDTRYLRNLVTGLLSKARSA